MRLFLVFIFLIYAAKSFGATITARQKGAVRFYDTDNSNYVELEASTDIASNIKFILPETDGSADQLLCTDGNLNLGWCSAATEVSSQDISSDVAGSGDYNTGNTRRYWSNIYITTGSLISDTSNSTDGTELTVQSACASPSVCYLHLVWADRTNSTSQAVGQILLNGGIICKMGAGSGAGATNNNDEPCPASIRVYENDIIVFATNAVRWDNGVLYGYIIKH